MHPEPPSRPLDLLVVGGLTIDRFTDGRAEPGGSVLHVARALVPRGLRVGIVTAAGAEAGAAEGIAELRRLDPGLACAAGAATTTFRHAESPAGRRLWLERLGGDLPAAWRDAAAILIAPVAGEIGAGALASLPAGPRRGAIVQGWLRSADTGSEVMPLPLRALGAPLTEALAAFDLLVASREDLRAEAATPSQQLAALRAMLGPRPVLVVTDGVAGLWLDIDGDRRHVPPPRVVAGVATVGAGDILAAHLLSGDWSSPSSPARLASRATAAMEIVADVLAERARRH